LTGPYGTEAQHQVRAAQLAVAQFNDAGGRMSALFIQYINITKNETYGEDQ
jgi:ABC-type branched-subunit amino acid transport system substrate-binding protein